MKWLFIFVFFLLSSLPSFANDIFHVGIFAYRPATVTENRWQYLEQYLEQQVPNSDFVLEVLDLEQLEQGVRQNRFDFVLTNPVHFIQMRSKYPLSGALGTLVRVLDQNTVSAIGGVIFTRADNHAIQQLEDVAKASISSPSPITMGGYMAPLYELQQAGIDIDKLDVEFTHSTHDSVVENVLTGKTDVGFIRTSILEQLIQEGQLAWNQIKLIHLQALSDYPFVVSTRLYPEWPFIALPKVRETTARKVASAILGLDSRHQVSQKIGISGFTVPADYLPVEQSMRELGVAPYDVEPKVSFKQVWQQHSFFILVLIFTISLILLLLLVIARQNISLRLSEQKVTEYLKEIEKRHQFLRSTFSAIPDLVWIKDQHGVYLDCNSRYESYLNKSRNKIIGEPDQTHFPSVEAEHIHAHDQEVLRLRLPSVQEDLYHFKSDGHDEILEVIKTPILDSSNQIIGILGIGRDITDRKQAEKDLSLSREVFENTLEGIMITDHRGTIVDVNPAFNRITGYSHEEVVGQNPSILSSGRQESGFYAHMWQDLQKKGYWKGEIWNRKKSGEIYAELLSISALKGEDGSNQFYVGIFSDITHSKQQQEQLSLMAHYDVLTELPNRALFADRFNQAILHSKRNQKLLAVCFIDLDNFKPVNDNYGHETGDLLLVEVANRLLDSVRGEDTVSRLGGDEFALLLNDIGSQKECMRMLDRILHKLENPFVINGFSHYISASIGATLYPSDDEDVDTLLRHADQAMYQAKLAGKQRYYLFDAAEDKIVSQKQLVQEQVKKALHADELTLFYQPKVNMATGEVFGAEALIRWQHPEKGLISPLEFLPYLTATEMEVEIGEWVISQAIQQLHEWSSQGLVLEISVNIASYHLQKDAFITRLAYALEGYPGLDASKLQLEVLESSVLSDVKTIRKTIEHCQQQLGVTVSLDDFGTGYSSLTHLRSFTADTVKIDKSFIQDMLDDPNDHVIVDGVIGLAESFGRDVIAEGVESCEHGLMLMAMGCHLAQGYGIARPMPAADIPAWLADYQPDERWLQYASRPHSLSSNKALILELTVERWYRKLVAKIQSESHEGLDWPILDKDRCHYGIWIESVAKEHIFKPTSLARLDQAHEALHSIANELFALYQKHDYGAAREGLSRLHHAYEQICRSYPDKPGTNDAESYSRGYL